MILKNCKYIITQNKDRKILDDFDILIKGNRIKKISKATLKEDFSENEEVIDCSEKIILPGLTNAHSHVAMTIFRGFYDDHELFDWLGKINPIEDKLTFEMVSVGAEVGIMEMLSRGIVAFIDTYYFPQATLEVSQNYGIRLVSGRVLVADLKKRMEENDALIKKQNGLYKVIADAYAIYANSIDNFKLIRDYAKKRNLRINIHAAETRQEVFNCYKENGKYVIEYLDSLNLLNNAVLAHCGWVTKSEISILKNRNAVIVHNPASNMKLATGAFFPYSVCKSLDVPIALGTDGAASNNSLNLFDEMKLMALLNKNNHWDASVINAQEVLDSSTINGANATGFDNGSIEEGKLADLIAIDANTIELQPLTKENLVSNLVYAYNSPVDFTIIDGRVVFKKEFLEEWKWKTKRLSQKIRRFFKKNL